MKAVVLPILFLALVPGCRGCERDRHASASDAAGEASAARGPWTAHVVARVLAGSPSLTRLDDDALGITSPEGRFAYLAGSDGRLRLVGEPANYGALSSEPDDDLGGYEAGSDVGFPELSGTGGRPVLTIGPQQKPFAWDGRAWKPVPPVDAGADDPVAPSGEEWRAHRLLEGGLVAWLGARDGKDEVFLADRKGVGTSTSPTAAPRDGAPLENGRCSFIDAADGRAYLTCAGAQAGPGEAHSIVELADRRWRDVSHRIGELENVGELAVDAEGGLWSAERAQTNGASALVRSSRDGSVERIVLPDPGPARGYYAARDDLLADRGGATRTWRIVGIEPPTKEETPRWVAAIVPRRSGDVWVSVAERGVYTVVRIARGASAPAPIVIGSGTDQRSELRNLREPRAWTGHCPQVFITLGFGADAGTSTVTSARIAAIEAILEKHRSPDRMLPSVTLVAGRLGTRQVVGALLLRTLPEVKERTLEIVATQLVERFTPNPASPPPASCTAPVLDEVLHAFP